MLALLLLLGLAPPADRLTAPTGPRGPHLGQHAARQWRLSSSDGWRAFRARWGGRWAARWDERSGAPRFLYAPGVPLARVQELVGDVALLAGVDPDELSLAAQHQRGEHSILRFERSWHGAQVLGDHVSVVAVNGRIGAVWVQLHPVRLAQQPEPGELVLPLPSWKAGRAWIDEATGVRAHLARRTVEGHQVVFRDRAGRELQRYDQRHWASVTLSHDERTVGDDIVQDPARQVTVTDAAGATAISADDGSHSLSGELEVLLEGPSLRVWEQSSEIRVAGSDDMLLEGDVDLPLSATQVQHAFHQGWDWLLQRWPSHAWLSAQVPATVELDYAACNAYYTSGTINFFVGYEGSCNNPGRIADVVLHELGHGFHHYVLQTGTFASDISEGSADYVAATILGDPALAPEFYPGSDYLREIDSDKVYPDDLIGEEHNDGLIWGSFLWNLREQWSDTYGEELGVEMADQLMLGALEQGPTLTDVYQAVITADDDDGDLSDGTPHGCELVALLDQHGLGPGPIGVVSFDHEPLGSQGSSVESYPLELELFSATPECGDLDEDSVQLWFAVEPALLPGQEQAQDELPRPDSGGTDTAEPGDSGAPQPDPYEGWQAVELERDGDLWSGVIPRQPATSRVFYFMQASSGDGEQVVYTHAGAQAGLYSFRVGDRQEIWCEGFEHGASDWEHGSGTPLQPDTEGIFTDEWSFGTPTGGTFLPDGPYEGSLVATTALDAWYSANNRQYLRSPAVEIEAPGPMLLLSYQRWLTVEDGIYDHARLLTGEDLLWANPASEAGSDHTLDVGWTEHDVELGEQLEGPGSLRFTWTLSSDQGLEYGGWALDRVCVVQLDDPEGHYRAQDLVASDDAAVVEISWSQPWITPMSATALVRKAGGWPEGVHDGVVVDLDFSPEPGEERVAEDDQVELGQSFHYALFVAGEHDEDWYSQAVEGENADQGGVPEDPPPPDTDDEDTGGIGAPDDSDAAPCEERDDRDDDDDDGCDCAASPGTGGVAWLLMLLGVVARRRE